MQVLALEAKEREANQMIWAKEMTAQRYGGVVDALWNNLNASSNKLDVLASLPFEEMKVADWSVSEQAEYQIQIHHPTDLGAKWNAQAWRQFLSGMRAAGWQLIQIEFRHNQFDMDDSGSHPRSQFYFAAHLTNPVKGERAILEGSLGIDWTAPSTDVDQPSIKQIDARHITIKTRRGQPGFSPIFHERVFPPEKSFFIDPLILYDLDGDGLSEIILAAKNLLFRRQQNGQYISEPLTKTPLGLIFTAVIADFDGNGTPDLLCAQFDGLVLFEGSANGKFETAGRLVWHADPRLKYGQVLTCGDIDHDGDLDIWLGQYKNPYDRGQMPTPYYDANDGNPGYLLLNDGKGNFTDATAGSGLEKKRYRRTYSASFVDLDGDNWLDLVVVSDFSGIDLYRNDGHGHFEDVTDRWIPERHAAGMAHAVADFDLDGELDLLMTGMTSATVERLDHAHLTRPGAGGDPAIRSKLMHGNRLYFGSRQGSFKQLSASESIARSGWSWGCSAFDFDNDGYPDVYIANGHETKQLVEDYETEFWLHDIYIGSSQEDPVVATYFAMEYGKTRARGYSYGGYNKNRLFWNQKGTNFLEIGHLMGVALETDSRDVVADDLDGDGRPDLLLTTFEAWPEPRQVLHVFKNDLPSTGAWIGVRLREEGSGISPVGAKITVKCGSKAMVKQLITGDSYRSQHANSAHFGLGSAHQVDSIEVRWTTGRIVKIDHPEMNHWHDIRLGK